MKRDILTELFDIIESEKHRRRKIQKSLMEDGIVKTNEKAIEEHELLEATTEKRSRKKEKPIHETAVWFHVMVLLSYQDIHIRKYCMN